MIWWCSKCIPYYFLWSLWLCILWNVKYFMGWWCSKFCLPHPWIDNYMGEYKMFWFQKCMWSKQLERSLLWNGSRYFLFPDIFYVSIGFGSKYLEEGLEMGTWPYGLVDICFIIKDKQLQTNWLCFLEFQNSNIWYCLVHYSGSSFIQHRRQ